MLVHHDWLERIRIEKGLVVRYSIFRACVVGCRSDGLESLVH